MSVSRSWQQSLVALFVLISLLMSTSVAMAEDKPVTQQQTTAEITALLQDFLAKVDQAATHDRFWAEDLIYTSSAGKVNRKADIMKGFEAPPAKADLPAEPKESYSADDIVVRQFGDTAALTFRLTRHAADGSQSHYRNSGMFVRRNSQWQVVTWQATVVPVEPTAG
ncbi:MAG: nuclear transport factor 2 family protein [Pseudomarimonas sp.]